MMNKATKDTDNNKIKFGRTGIASAFSGGASGLISSIILQPLDVLKTNLIIMPKNLQKTSKAGMFESFSVVSKYIYDTRGVKGFWIGTLPGVAKAITSASVFFYVLPICQNLLKNEHGFSEHTTNFLSSGFSRCLSTLVANPFNVVKTRMLLFDRMSEYPSLFVAIKKIYKKEGSLGFLKGGITVMLRDFPFGSIMYTTYTIINKTFEDGGKEHKILYFFSAILAGSIATICTQPFEIIRIHLQANESVKGASKKPLSLTGGVMGEILATAYREHGIGFVTKGLLPRLVRKPMINAATFFFYEVLTR